MSAMKEVWSACSDAGTLSLDGRDRYVYAIRDHRNRLRVVVLAHGPDSRPVQRLVAMNKSVVLCDSYHKGFQAADEQFVLLMPKEAEVASC